MSEFSDLHAKAVGSKSVPKFKPKVQATAHQQERLKVLHDWWESDEKHAILTGEPGTGKTFLASQFTDTMDGAFPIFTAPTNEAARQLELALNNEVTPKTTYSALGLRLSDWSATQRIYQGKVPDDLAAYNLFVVDEASMADKANEEKENAVLQLMDYVDQVDKKILWLGDEAQLPPVADKYGNSSKYTMKGRSPIFHQGYTTAHLSEVVRHEGDILKYARQLREQVFAEKRRVPKFFGEINELTQRTYKDYILQQEVFDSIRAGDTKLIAWTNKQVDFFNTLIRSEMYSRKVAMGTFVCPGDQIVFTSPLMHYKGDLYTSHPKDLVDNCVIRCSINTRAEVIKTSITSIWGVECYKTELHIENSSTAIAYFVTKKGMAKYKALEKLLRNDALELKKAKKAAKARDAWRLFYAVTGIFAHAKHSYAMTSYRAQGSTIPNIIADSNNLLRNPDKLAAYKSFYVAATRAKNSLTIIRG